MRLNDRCYIPWRPSRMAPTQNAESDAVGVRGRLIDWLFSSVLQHFWMRAAQLNDGKLVASYRRVIAGEEALCFTVTNPLQLTATIKCWFVLTTHCSVVSTTLTRSFSQQSEMLINQLREITGIQDPETLYKALNVRTKRATDGVQGSKTKRHPLLCIVCKASWFHTLNTKMLLAQKYNPNTWVSQSTKIVCV